LNKISGLIKWISLCLLTSILITISNFAQSNDDCFACHDDNSLKGTRNGKSFSAFVNDKSLVGSVHKELKCVECHTDVNPDDLPHADDLKKVNCSTCHTSEGDLYKECLHGKASAKGDKLAPICQTCHGTHNILQAKNPKSPTYPFNIPYLCGRCHREGTPVQLQRHIPQDRILENYSESIHGEGLLKKGLIVAATCVSCHTAHRVLPHTDLRSTISRKNIASTCAACHVQIESVHQKTIQGSLWEKEAHVLPACVECHQPHKIRKVFYNEGFSNTECLKCHSDRNIVASKDKRNLFVDENKILVSTHNKVNCSQCHVITSIFKNRPCETFVSKVDCASCHAQVGVDYQKSIHGKLNAKNDSNAPFCKDCHGTHEVMARNNPRSPIFSINIPKLCAACHRAGQKAAIRIKGDNNQNIIEHYTESIHGKGLLKSGLTVTATCTDCHTSHRELPKEDQESSINHLNVAATCGACHLGIEEQFNKSVHSPSITKTDKFLPVCNTCHSAHSIIRADSEGFKLTIMNQCGKCHEKIAETYFDTYHGKVSQLGYTKTAKCYDCHGAHDILPITNLASHLSRKNVVKTCQKCHPSANKQFAGYFSHATHHDPEKYPMLFWTFWGMTGLLLGTFVLAGIHTLLWLPRSLKWRREVQKLHAENEQDLDNNPGKGE
jgi:hypothetical protein